jgi:hypothetical protein
MNDEIQKKCNKIYEISNHIYNSIKSKVDYTNPRSIIVSYLGFKKRFSQDEFRLLKEKCDTIKYILHQVEMKMSILDYTLGNNISLYPSYIVNNIDVFEMYLEDFGSHFEDINAYIKYLCEKPRNGENNISLVLQKENTKEGTEWLYELYNFYLKYNGERNVSSNDFFNHIKMIWNSIENIETIQISYITDNILGGISIYNISSNLKDWVIKNKDAIRPNYRDIIDTTNTTNESIEYIPMIKV